MKKVSLSSNSVAYFDDTTVVDEPGFYLLEGETSKSESKVYDGGEFATHEDTENAPDGLLLDGRGRPVFKTAPELKKTITVTHETEMTPGRRVWASPDGDGFVFDEPSAEALGQGDQWQVAGGEN